MLLMAWMVSTAQAEGLPEFNPTGDPGEQVRWTTLDFGVRVYVNAPAQMKADDRTDVILFATPNGNTIEQTLGGSSPTTAQMDWHNDIQHVLAQTRKLREVESDRNIVLAVTDTPQKSWPAFRKAHPDIPPRAAAVVAEARRNIPGKPVRLTVTGHSGGGSFIFAVIEGKTIADNIDRIAFLDAQYNYADAAHHEKLATWLRGANDRRLIAIAYDDREIILDGKKVVGPEGGTYRATHRMIDTIGKDFPFVAGTEGPFDAFTALDGRIRFLIHPNPENKILHTRLVGEMNGLLEAMTVGTEFEGKWGTFGGPRAYEKWVRPIPVTRPATVPAAFGRGGVEIMKSLASLSTSDRETVIAERLKSGDMPKFMSAFKTIHVTAILSDGKTHSIDFQVSPDYLSVGTDTDFVRTPLTPRGAMPILAAMGCTLPTKKMVDEIDSHAEVKLAPVPMTANRESVNTFLESNQQIEAERGGKTGLITGVKKDVVFTNRLHETPGKVAIYGWRQLDGTPIQPLTTVHVNSYVDYSHGIRAVKQTAVVDGKAETIAWVLKDPVLSALLSDEGAIDIETMYREFAMD